jgi:hypothetical protein
VRWPPSSTEIEGTLVRERQPTMKVPGLAGRAVIAETVYSAAKLVGRDLDGCLDRMIEGSVGYDVTIVVG